MSKWPVILVMALGVGIPALAGAQAPRAAVALRVGAA